MKQLFTTPHFDKWFDKLRDHKAKVAIDKRFRQIEAGNYGDWKSVGEGVCELRFHLGAGYRVYFTERGNEIVIVLAGGDKSSQQRDIRNAIAIAKLV